MEKIAKDPRGYLILEGHPDFPGQWLVNSLKQGFLIDFIDLIGPYRTVGPGSLPTFLARAKEKGYQIAFADEPTTILDVFNDLNVMPEISLNSQFGNTTCGLLEYQVQGYNFLKDKKAGVAMWSTGTGKTVLASALLKFHYERRSFDYAFFVVKTHNKINTQRSLSRLADIDSVVLDGPQKRRHETIVGLSENPLVPKVIVTNYEKFRVDQHLLLPLFENSRVLIIWDEMPSKLKNRKTVLYKSIRKLLYKRVNLAEQRPKDLRQYMLSATPIENSPEDWFNCVRLLDPTTYGSITDFHSEYVANWAFNTPTEWRDLDRMGLKAAHMVHQIDKESPDIAKQFPKVIETPRYIDWHENDRKIYDQVLDEIETKDPLALIQVAQFLCDAPSMVQKSADLYQRYQDAIHYKTAIPNETGSKLAYEVSQIVPLLKDSTHTKLEALRELITETHKDEKIVLFSSYNEALLPILEQHLQRWLVNYVRYDGNIAEKQIAQDYFQKEDFVQVFLTSDQGSDSISLEEASVVIHYDLPWKWSTFIQRQNRAHRVTSKWDHVRFYTLMMANSIEERKMEVLMKKAGFHDAVFKGHISEQAEAARLTKEDLLYILGR